MSGIEKFHFTTKHLQKNNILQQQQQSSILMKPLEKMGQKEGQIYTRDQLYQMTVTRRKYYLRSIKVSFMCRNRIIQFHPLQLLLYVFH